jgi:hypothetical protein
MLTGWSKEELLGTKKYIWEVNNLSSLTKCGDAHGLMSDFREPVCRGVLGELRHPCIREHSAISVFPLCPSET